MSAPDANGWFDIETAPDDRREFLVWFPSMQEVGYGFYAEEGYGYPAAFRYFWFNVEEGADLNVPSECPSHWQPLPSPPITNSSELSPSQALTKPNAEPLPALGTPSTGAA